MLRFFKSFQYAFQGIRFSLHEQLSIKIEIAAALTVILFAFYFEITKHEWIAVLLCIGLVISMEMVNSAIENLVDLVSPQIHPIAGKVKDIASAAVLVASIVAAAVGVIVFLPYFIQAFGNFQGER